MLVVVGECGGWYFCHGDSTGAIIQALLHEGAATRSPGKPLWAGADSGLYLRGLDSCPLPRAAHSCPEGAPSTRKERDNPPLVSSSLQCEECHVSPTQAMKIGHLFVENTDLFCSCVTGKQNCAWDLIIIIWFGVCLFVCFKYGLL